MRCVSPMADEENTLKYGFYDFHEGRKLAARAAFVCVFFLLQGAPDSVCRVELTPRYSLTGLSGGR
jgi:hypothetical protein